MTNAWGYLWLKGTSMAKVVNEKFGVVCTLSIGSLFWSERQEGNCLVAWSN